MFLNWGRPTLATLESTAFLALGFGPVNEQDFRKGREHGSCNHAVGERIVTPHIAMVGPSRAKAVPRIARCCEG